MRWSWYTYSSADTAELLLVLAENGAWTAVLFPILLGEQLVTGTVAVREVEIP